MNSKSTNRQIKQLLTTTIFTSFVCLITYVIMAFAGHVKKSSWIFPSLVSYFVFIILFCLVVLIFLSPKYSFAEKLSQKFESMLGSFGFVLFLEMTSLLTIVVTLYSLFLIFQQHHFRTLAPILFILIWLATTHLLILFLLLNLVPLNYLISHSNRSIYFSGVILLIILSTIAIQNIPLFPLTHFFNKLTADTKLIQVIIGIAITQPIFILALVLSPDNKIYKRMIYSIKKITKNLRANPVIASLAITIIFFAIVFVFFYPAYGSYDEMNLVSILNGYFNGKTQPLLININVLLGFLLTPLIHLFPVINWLTIFELIIHFLSLWSLIFVFLTVPNKYYFNWAIIIATILIELNFLPLLTYTTTAAFATISGISLFIATIRYPTKHFSHNLVFGPFLILAAIFMRREPVVMVIGFASPLILLIIISCNWRKWLPISLITITLLGSALLFDHFYYKLFPDWSEYLKYYNIRVSLFDTPRNDNLFSNTQSLQKVNWSENDIWLFDNTFIPDGQVYSYNNLIYLSETTSALRGTFWIVTKYFLVRVFSSLVLPYFILFLTIWLAVVIQTRKKKIILYAVGLFVFFFTADLYMSWAMKLPYRILIPSLAAPTIFSAFLPCWFSQSSDELAPDKNFIQFTKIFLSFFMALIAVFVLSESVSSSLVNRLRNTAYDQINSDIVNLQTKGVISKNPLFISNGIGIPWEWSNSLLIDFPTSYKYLPTSWLTFTPPYQAVLDEYNIHSVFEALYKNSNVYLVARPDIISHISEFIFENQGINTIAIDLYKLPINGLDGNYTNTHIYKLEQDSQ